MWIHTFSLEHQLLIKCKSLAHHSNSCRRIHFLRRYLLHNEHPYRYMYTCRCIYTRTYAHTHMRALTHTQAEAWRNLYKQLASNYLSLRIKNKPEILLRRNQIFVWKGEVPLLFEIIIKLVTWSEFPPSKNT